jgi:hypothetical protein
MVLKSELLSNISSKFGYMKTPELVLDEQYGGHTKKTYQVQVCRVNGVLATMCYFCMYVFNEGTENEAAFVETQQAPDELQPA